MVNSHLYIFFNKPERSCGKLWTFTRVPEYELVGPGDLEIRNIYSRRQCQDECLRSPRGPCRYKKNMSKSSIISALFLQKSGHVSFSKSIINGLTFLYILRQNCRSVTYYARERMCKLSSETRRTKPESFRKSGPDVDYMENECAPGIIMPCLPIAICK